MAHPVLLIWHPHAAILGPTPNLLAPALLKGFKPFAPPLARGLLVWLNPLRLLNSMMHLFMAGIAKSL